MALCSLYTNQWVYEHYCLYMANCKKFAVWYSANASLKLYGIAFVFQYQQVYTIYQ